MDIFRFTVLGAKLWDAEHGTDGWDSGFAVKRRPE